MRRSLGLVAAGGLFVGALGVAWWSHGTGVVHDDPAHHLAVPKVLTVPLQVQAAYDDTRIFVRYRWPAARPGIFHDVLRHEGGKWVTVGAAVPGSQPDGMHEDRVAMMLDDGSVPEFGRYGGYAAIGAGIAGFSDEASGEAVKAHAHLGKTLGESEVTKHLPGTRRSPGDWADTVAPETLGAQRAAGYFVDLWHWRANRSNPLGVADDQVIAEARLGDQGRGAFATNWDGEKKQPRFMFDAAKAGHAALRWDDIAAGRVTQATAYALTPDTAAPFDAAASWRDGDVIPRRVLRLPAESRADIAVQGVGRWADGFWDVTMTRALDTGHPLDDKILRDQGSYTVAFAIHRDATGGRWHYVSLPFSLGLGRAAEISAQRFTGPAPAWGDAWTEVTLFYPGQVGWPLLTNSRHAGATSIAQGVPVRFRHSPEQLASCGIEMEFADAIRRQWLLTLGAGIVLIAAFGFAINRLSSTRGA